MVDMATRFPVLARASGRWTGLYIHLDPDGVEIDRHAVDTLSDFPDDGLADFRLCVHNRWADGRETRMELLADCRENRLEWRDRLVGWMAELDDRTIYLNFTYADDPGLRVCEMIQVSPDGQHRARTWHWFRNEVLAKITITRETRA